MQGGNIDKQTYKGELTSLTLLIVTIYIYGEPAKEEGEGGAFPLFSPLSRFSRFSPIFKSFSIDPIKMAFIKKFVKQGKIGKTGKEGKH